MCIKTLQSVIFISLGDINGQFQICLYKTLKTVKRILFKIIIIISAYYYNYGTIVIKLSWQLFLANMLTRCQQAAAFLDFGNTEITSEDISPMDQIASPSFFNEVLQLKF